MMMVMLKRKMIFKKQVKACLACAFFRLTNVKPANLESSRIRGLIPAVSTAPSSGQMHFCIGCFTGVGTPVPLQGSPGTK